MKILITQETDWVKRYPAQQHHLAEMLSLRGHEVRAIDYELSWKNGAGKGFLAKRTVFNNIVKIHPDARVTLIRPGFIRLSGLSYISMMLTHKKEIQRQIKEFRPDVIVGFGILSSYSAIRAVRKTGIPFIYYWIDVLHLLIPDKPLRAVGKMVESAALKLSDRVLVINDSLRETVIKMGAPDEKTGVLRAGINLAQFDLKLSGNIIRKQYGIREQDTVLFFMGFLYRFSGLKEVVRELAASGKSNLKLLIVGEGDLYGELTEIRDKYHLEKQIILAGKKPYSEIPSFIAASDVCLLPAYPQEPIMQNIVPIKMYEYMAMKKPVIASRLPGVMKEFDEGNGVVYIDKPGEAVARAVEIVQNSRVTELGIKARQFAERNSWDKITDEFEKILKESVMERRNG